MKWKTYNFNEEFYAIFAIFTLFIARQKFSIPGTKNYYLGLLHIIVKIFIGGDDKVVMVMVMHL